MGTTGAFNFKTIVYTAKLHRTTSLLNRDQRHDLSRPL